jgi:hypothetical protein
MAVLADQAYDDLEMIEAMGALRANALDPRVDGAFDTRVLRKWRVYRTKASIWYWSPALAGASVAAVAVLAVLQVLAHSREIRPIHVPGAEVRREVWTGPFPDLLSPGPKTFVR